MSVSTAVFLGAGASADAGVPTTVQMTRRIYELIASGADPGYIDDRLSRALGTVIGGLLYRQGIRGDDPYEGLNVEEVFASVGMLANRNSLEAAPFIGSWHEVIEDLDQEPVGSREYDALYTEVARSVASELREAIEGYSGTSTLRKHIDGALKKKPQAPDLGKAVGAALEEILKDVERRSFPRAGLAQRGKFRKGLDRVVSGNPQSGRGEVFRRLSEHMVRSLRGLVWLGEDVDVLYLEPLLELGTEKLAVYSLNYDNAVERLCERRRIAVSVGITESGGVEFDSGAAVHLMKLHGSIDWAETDTEDPERPLPMPGIKRLEPDRMTADAYPMRPAIIFGQGNKLTASGPYLELLRHFRADVESHRQLLVIGYSFRDDHINHYIAQWFNGAPDRRIIVVNGSRFTEYAQKIEFANTLMERGGDRVVVIPERAKAGIPKAVALCSAG